MTPIRNETNHTGVLIAFWAFVLIAVVLAIGSISTSIQAKKTSQRVEKAICTEIIFLEGSAVSNQRLAADLRATPEEVKARNAGLQRALKLASDLRSLEINCPQKEG